MTWVYLGFMISCFMIISISAFAGVSCWVSRCRRAVVDFSVFVICFILIFCFKAVGCLSRYSQSVISELVGLGLFRV